MKSGDIVLLSQYLTKTHRHFLVRVGRETISGMQNLTSSTRPENGVLVCVHLSEDTGLLVVLTDTMHAAMGLSNGRNDEKLGAEKQGAYQRVGERGREAGIMV